MIEGPNPNLQAEALRRFSEDDQAGRMFHMMRKSIFKLDGRRVTDIRMARWNFDSGHPTLEFIPGDEPGTRPVLVLTITFYAGGVVEDELLVSHHNNRWFKAHHQGFFLTEVVLDTEAERTVKEELARFFDAGVAKLADAQARESCG